MRLSANGRLGTAVPTQRDGVARGHVGMVTWGHGDMGRTRGREDQRTRGPGRYSARRVLRSWFIVFAAVSRVGVAKPRGGSGWRLAVGNTERQRQRIGTRSRCMHLSANGRLGTAVPTSAAESRGDRGIGDLPQTESTRAARGVAPTGGLRGLWSDRSRRSSGR